jgi:hypothetical protein
MTGTVNFVGPQRGRDQPPAIALANEGNVEITQLIFVNCCV